MPHSTPSDKSTPMKILSHIDNLQIEGELVSGNITANSTCYISQKFDLNEI